MQNYFLVGSRLDVERICPLLLRSRKINLVIRFKSDKLAPNFKTKINMKSKWGALMVDGRGKLGGHVMAKNRSGSYMRTKVTPVNPATASQVQARNLLTFFAQSWRTLTAAQITAWNAAVENYKRTNIFGDIINPTGLNLYVRLNVNIANAGGADISDPPIPGTAPEIGTCVATLNSGAQSVSIAFAPTPVPANIAYVVELTAQVSPGINFLKGKYRIIAVFPAADATPTVISAAYIAKFGALIAGQKVGLRVTAVDTLTGITSQPDVSQSLVA